MKKKGFENNTANNLSIEPKPYVLIIGEHHLQDLQNYGIRFIKILIKA